MKKILVLGESCRDIFVYCKAEKLAPDLPIPVLSIVEEVENPGMASNVERNIKAIHPEVDLYTNYNWREVSKTRYMHESSNHAFLRVDTDHSIIERVDITEVPLADYDLIAISDYHKGFLTPEDIRYVCEHHNNVFIDTKKILGEWAAGATYIKINNYEYERSQDFLTPELEKKVIYTKGGEGTYFNGKNFPISKVEEVKDVTGAGDSFYAALVVKYLQTEDIEQAIEYANKCASEVVKHKGVTIIKTS